MQDQLVASDEDDVFELGGSQAVAGSHPLAFPTFAFANKSCLAWLPWVLA
jgi:hypothetical protein